MTQKLFKGVDYDFGVEVLRLSPLTLAAVEEYEDFFATVGELGKKEQIKKMKEIIHCSLQRNYPEFTFEKLNEYLDLSNTLEVFNIVCQTSGLISGSGVEKGSVGDNQGK